LQTFDNGIFVSRRFSGKLVAGFGFEGHELGRRIAGKKSIFFSITFDLEVDFRRPVPSSRRVEKSIPRRYVDFSTAIYRSPARRASGSGRTAGGEFSFTAYSKNTTLVRTSGTISSLMAKSRPNAVDGIRRAATRNFLWISCST